MDEPRPPGEQASPFARLVLAPNAGPMTLDGTNSYVLAAPGASGVVVVDPGPADETHLARLASFGRVELVLVTHHHFD
ncbi:MAG TPA: MBL fold metallo-hydrolase, partial [Agromyces sp.]|nr:MBL fold metallo-hydrolase [Agromyces sp.]